MKDERPIRERIDRLDAELGELLDYRLAFRRVALEVIRVGYGRFDHLLSMCRHLYKPSGKVTADVLMDVINELISEGLVRRNANSYNVRYVLIENVKAA